MVEKEKSETVRPLPPSDHRTLYQYSLYFFVSKVSILLSFSNIFFVDVPIQIIKLIMMIVMRLLTTKANLDKLQDLSIILCKNKIIS